jgi:hypothetical protein
LINLLRRFRQRHLSGETESGVKNEDDQSTNLWELILKTRDFLSSCCQRLRIRPLHDD